MLTTDERSLLNEIHDSTLRLEVVLCGLAGQPGTGLIQDVASLKREQEREKGFRKATLAIIAFIALVLEPLITWLATLPRRP